MSATTALDGPGAVHIERIVRECIAARTPAHTATIRLLAATDLAGVLDHLETR